MSYGAGEKGSLRSRASRLSSAGHAGKRDVEREHEGTGLEDARQTAVFPCTGRGRCRRAHGSLPPAGSTADVFLRLQ